MPTPHAHRYAAGLVAAGTALGLALSVTVAPSVATASGAAPLARSGDSVVSAYTLIVPRSAARHQLQTRAVVPNGVACPKVRVVRDGKVRHLTMTMRVPGVTTGAAFASMRACQANLPTRLSSASVSGITVPASLPRRFKKLVLLGDTGCRVDEDLHQDCANPARWPLARNSRSIAREKADALLFTGDFYYREEPCENTPTDSTVLDKCGGSPAPIPGMDFKDTDYGWFADVFLPMAPILRTTPLLIARGNHEDCPRGGNGFALFFDSSPHGAQSCAPDPTTGKVPRTIEPTWSFDLPITGKRTLRTVVVDTAGGKNVEVSPWVATQRPKYVAADRMSRRVKGRESWLLTHRPMFGVDSVNANFGEPWWNQWTSVDQTAAAQGLISNYDALIASHVHVSQVVQIPGQPSQVVIGNGSSIPDFRDGYTAPRYGPLRGGDGVPLSPDFTPYPTLKYLWTQVRYGYVVAEPQRHAHRWTMTQKTVRGKTFATCEVVRKRTRCTDR